MANPRNFGDQALSVVPPSLAGSGAWMELLEARLLLSGGPVLLNPLGPLAPGDPPAENQPPVAGDDAFTTDQDRTLVTDSVLANDTDPDGDGLRVVGHTQPDNGVAILLRHGRFVYRPAAGFSGTDTFEYTVGDGHAGTDSATVTLTVLPAAANQPPEATDDEATTQANQTVTIEDVLANDSDPDGDPLRVVGHTQPANGIAWYGFAGRFHYRPNEDFVGTDAFEYTVGDGRGGTDTATVTLTVDPAPPNQPPVAADDEVSGLADRMLITDDLLANDVDPDGDRLRIVGVTQGDHGRVSYLWCGRLLYVPEAGFVGTDSFEYTVGDGRGGEDTATVTVTIDPAPANDPPEAVDDEFAMIQDTVLYTPSVLANDSDPNGDRLRIVANTDPANGTAEHVLCGHYKYVPNADFVGTDTFDYTVSDGHGNTATATVTIVVAEAPPNEAPVAADDEATTLEGRPVVTPNVLANDIDADGDRLRVIDHTDPANGTIVPWGLKRFLYTPNEGFTGTDTFTYTVSDGRGGTDTGTVTITVEERPANQPPDAQDDEFTTVADKRFSTPSVYANDSDPDGGALRMLEYTQPANGQVYHALFGHFVYTPNEGFTGTDTFTYTIGDGRGGTDTATVTLLVEPPPPNIPPVAEDDEATTTVDRPVVIHVLGNDTDPDGGWLRIVEVSEAANGTVVAVGFGCILYRPAEGFTGTDTFEYTISDGTDTAAATVTVTVDPLAEPGPHGRGPR